MKLKGRPSCPGPLSHVLVFVSFLSRCFQEEQNRGKPNWEHLNEDLHVLLTVEDTQSRAEIKMRRAVDEVKKLLVPAVSTPSNCPSVGPAALLPFSHPFYVLYKDQKNSLAKQPA